MNLRDLFPNLTDDNHEITSPSTIDYNCIAWAAGNTQRWWQPGVYWPIESTKDDYGIGELVLAFESMGYRISTMERWNRLSTKLRCTRLA